MLERWIEEDPLGLSAGDANIYRMEENDTINFTDSSGLELPYHGYPYLSKEQLEAERKAALLKAISELNMELSENFSVVIIFEPGSFSLEERRAIRAIMLKAAQRLEMAFNMLDKEWDQMV